MAIASVAACGDTDLGSAAPACDALVRIARQSAACDPALASLAEALAEQPDELECRVAVRRVLIGPEREPARVRSVWTPAQGPEAAPLSPEELESISQPSWPAELVVVPDIAPGPGVPPTVVVLDEVPLDPDVHGRLQGHLPPGVADLRLRHAGRETAYCVELRPCTTLRVTAHGDKLARHPDVRAGPC